MHAADISDEAPEKSEQFAKKDRMKRDWEEERSRRKWRGQSFSILPILLIESNQ
jgi:hypothetical protein